MIIIFSGTDGAGKSTQINLLIKWLEKDKKTHVLWGRGGYTPLFMFAKNILRKILRKKIPQSGKTESRSKILENKSVSSVWLIVATIDLFLYFGVYTRYLNILGRTVICDRYIDDTLLDFKRNFPVQFSESSFLWRMLSRFVPKPNASFLLYVPVEISIERSKLKNEPFPDTPETLAFRLESYLNESLFPSSHYYKINCQQPVDVIQTEIQTKLTESLK